MAGKNRVTRTIAGKISQKVSFWLGKTMGNTNSGWHLQVLNLQLAGTEERIFFPTEVKHKPKTCLRTIKKRFGQ